MDAVASLPVDSCIIDGEAIVVDQSGLSIFDLLRYRRHDHAATLCAFDLLELDGADYGRARSRSEAAPGVGAAPDTSRHRHQRDLCRRRRGGYEHACALGREGIVSKRLGSPYRAGRTDQWLKMKNPKAPAVRREREIDWAKR